MNWKLIFLLSMFGLAMALATVFFIPSNIEPAFWLPIFLLCAWLIARAAPEQAYAHGVLVGLLNSVWITTAHILFFERYIAGHPNEASMLGMMLNSPRLMMALTGPLVGLVSGAIIGLFAWIAAKFVKSRRHTADAM